MTDKIPPEKLEQLIKLAGEKLKTDPAKLKETINSGKLDELLSKNKNINKEKLDAFLSNPALLDKLLADPKAQRMINDFLNKK